VSHAVHRVEVRPKPGERDTRAEAFVRAAKALGASVSAASARVYLVQANLSTEQVRRIVDRLLVDDVSEVGTLGSLPSTGVLAEVHPLPGVMDPAAQSVRDAIKALTGVDAVVSTGLRLDLSNTTSDEARGLVRRTLANPVIHQITTTPWHPPSLPVGGEYTLRLRHVAIREKTEEELARLSREAHLFLSPEEMRAVRARFKELGRDPTDIELETLAQTWSEHCVHKTLKSTVIYRDRARPGESGQTHAAPRPLFDRPRPGHVRHADGSVTIHNLLKSTIAAATHELIADGVDWALSVFKDNSGVVALDERWGVNIKVETHNRPSAIEPYGGAATGAGGCIRDVIATGLGAKPIANTDVFCVADPHVWSDAAPESWQSGETTESAKRPPLSASIPTRQGPPASPLPPGVLHPRRILTDVVAGVRDYGNRMGIPTVNGAVAFDDRYVGNPLVFCGCVGLIPRDLVRGQARPGDRIIALGGRTGRDGIHGATFSSAELQSTASTEFAHAVQIGNAIEEKRLLDAILKARHPRARDSWQHAQPTPAEPLYTALTDCGAGGFSSAIGEMGAQLGAEVHLDRAPLKYAGLSYAEIWISEAQERIILAVPPANVEPLRRICEQEGVELADLGHFATDQAELVLFYKGVKVGQLPMSLLHDGIPMPTREAAWPPEPAAITPRTPQPAPTMSGALRALLAHPDIASKHWIIRQYDHEVQGNTVVKPLAGPGGFGPGDAAVLDPVPGSGRGVAIACGLQTSLGDGARAHDGADPYDMALAAIDECVRNLVCVGADPSRIAILDNFSWPSCERHDNLGALVRACAGCYDGAKAYRTPFVSGKDSLNNQLRYTDPVTGEASLIEIPYTLLITGLGIVPELSRCVTMDAKKSGNMLVLVGANPEEGSLAGSRYERLFGDAKARFAPVDPALGARAARAVAKLIRERLARAAHDVSDGGVLVAVTEMLLATVSPDAPPLGAALDMPASHAAAFHEGPARYILEIAPGDLSAARAHVRSHAGVELTPIGTLTDSGRLVWARAAVDEDVAELCEIWRSPLDW
jgi:phosphoribosylformylglycinamidine synthase